MDQWMRMVCLFMIVDKTHTVFIFITTIIRLFNTSTHFHDFHKPLIHHHLPLLRFIHILFTHNSSSIH